VRVPTRDGIAWFKEEPPADEFEPPLTDLLARRRPDCLPEVIAWDERRLLTRHVGPRLREVHDRGDMLPSWEEILPLYAEVQIDFMDAVPEALALGTPDDRPDLLPDRYAALGGDRLDTVGAAVERLAGTIPPTLAHMEAHDGNIFVRDGRPVFIDWAEAVVTHPFLGPLQALRIATERSGFQPGSPEVERLRDLYLEPFTRFAPLAELRELFADGYLLHGVSRAALWHRTLEGLAPEATAEYGQPVAAWLEIIRELADGTTTLGGA
jgi:hypothetical protein